MSTTGLPTSYQGHDISNTGDSLYAGSVKIYNGTAMANLSQAATPYGLGPQLFIGAHMLARWPAGDCYIAKYTVAGSGANPSPSSNNWSADDYANLTRGLARACFNWWTDAINLLLASYTDVVITLVSMTQGEEDSTQGVWAYNYRANLQNLVARFAERYSFADGQIPFWGWCQPLIPRDTTTVSNYNAELAYLVRAQAALAIARLQAIHGSSRIQVIDTSTIIASGDVSSDALHWSNQGQAKRIDALFAAYDAAVTAGYTIPTKSSGWTEDTTFDTLPTFSVSAAPSTTYSPNTAVTITLTANDFDAGHSVANTVWSCDDDTFISGSGGTLSVVPRKYGGLCIRALYENAKHYVAHYYGWTHILAPRTLTALGTPKLWSRQTVDVTLANATSMEISRILNHSGSNTAYAWQANSGIPKATHRGVAVMRSDMLRALQWNGSTFTTTSASQTAASLADGGSWVRIAQFKARWVSDTNVGHIFGVRVSASFGGGLALAANATPNNVGVIGRYGVTQLVPASGATDMGDLGDVITVAMRKNGTSFTLHYWNGSGVSIIGPVTYASMVDGFPDTINATGGFGIEGLIMEVIGAEVAPSDSDLAAIITQIAATDVPIVPRLLLQLIQN